MSSHLTILLRLTERVSSWTELEARIASLPTEIERGEAFEQFCRAFLLLGPVFQFKKVYRQNEIPPSLGERLGYPGVADLGIDGLAVSRDGKITAYQAKFRRDRTNTPSLRELSTFFTMSDKADWRLVITNANGLPASINDRTRQGRVLVDRLDQLGPDFFDRLKVYLTDSRVHPPAKKTPHETQQEAINSAIIHFRKNSRGQLILPCGTGKTLAAMWIAENLGGTRILVMVPSLALMSQTLREWAANTVLRPFRYLCLCSDTTVDLGNDSPIEHLYEMDIQVTTDSGIVSDFLRKEPNTPSVLFCTYQSSKVLSEATLKTGTSFDTGIFDEAHRTTGTSAGVWNIALNDEKVPIRRRISMTATPRIYAPRITKKAKENDILLYSMDDQEAYGRAFYEMSFGEAIKRNHITDYNVLVICVTDPEVREIIERSGYIITEDYEWNARALAKRIALAKGMDAYGLKKVFTFHGKIAGAKAFTLTSSGYGFHQVLRMLDSGFDGDGEMKFLHVNGTMSSAIRAGLLREFREADVGVMSNARCLIEGVDVPVVDTVAFIDPKKSIIDIVQATGRALRKEEWKGKGYIFVPVVVDKIGDPEKFINCSEFDTVWKVLQAMVDQDQRLEDIVSKLRILEGMGEQDTQLWKDTMTEFSERVEFFNLPRRIDQTRFISQVNTLVFERIARNWYFMYGLLKKYLQEYPSSWPSSGENYLGYNLGSWCNSQRQAKRKGMLSKKRLDLLEAVGFPWHLFPPDLWSSSELANAVGVHSSVVINWVRRKKIRPAEVYRSGKFTYYFFQLGYDKEVRKIFNVTLDNVEGLMSVKDAAELYKVDATTIFGLVRRNFLRPVGRVFISGGTGISMFFSRDSLEKTKKDLGITIIDKTGLMSAPEFAKALGVSKTVVYKWVRKGLIAPFGRGFQSGGKGFGDYFHPDQIQEIRDALGVTLDIISRREPLDVNLESTYELLDSNALAQKLGLKSYTTINKWINQKKVIPHGYGFAQAGRGVRAYFHPKQVEEIRRSFGVTLSQTRGLISLKEVAHQLGIDPALIHKWLKKKLIKADGRYWSKAGAGIEIFFKPEAVEEIRKTFGVTVESPKGLLSPSEFASKLGVDQSTVRKWVRKGLISSEVAFLPGAKKYVGYYFRKSQVNETRELFGANLVSTRGLLSQEEFAKKLGVKPVTVWSWVKRRKKLQPVGYKFAPGGKGKEAYFHPSQLKEIRRLLDI